MTVMNRKTGRLAAGPRNWYSSYVVPWGLLVRHYPSWQDSVGRYAKGNQVKRVVIGGSIPPRNHTY